jgi:hypothetical protein
MKKCKKKDVNIDLTKIVKEFPVKKIRPNISTKCSELYSDIENGYYGYKELITYFVHQNIYDKNIGLYNVNKKEIKALKKQYNKKQLKEDKQTILSVCKKLNINNIKELFEINVDGENLVYSMVLSNTISPIFYLQYYKKYFNSEIFKNDKFCRFENLITIIFKTLKTEVFYA